MYNTELTFLTYLQSYLSLDILRGMSVVRVQASALDVGSNITIQRYSFFEILEIILQSQVYILYALFSGSLYFFLMFQSYRELVII